MWQNNEYAFDKNSIFHWSKQENFRKSYSQIDFHFFSPLQPMHFLGVKYSLRQTITKKQSGSATAVHPTGCKSQRYRASLAA